MTAHVRTLRTAVYAFWAKRRFLLEPTAYAALVLLLESQADGSMSIRLTVAPGLPSPAV